jgi:SAM-dependent methyltransferase/alpha/beta superfamily hydrolase
VSDSSREQALYLRAGLDRVLAFHHKPAAGAATGAGVLICPPFGWDDVASHRALRLWAQQLADEGHPTVRFDLPGTGDSSGSPADPGRLDAWCEAVAAAATWLRDDAGAGRVTAIGIGLGGLVVARAASTGARLDDVVLWGAAASGRAAVRELHAFARLQSSNVGAPEAGLPEGWLEVGGFVLSAETVAAIAAIDPSALQAGSVRRALLLGRDAAATGAAFADNLRAQGVAVEQAPGPGYAAMVSHPQTSPAPRAVFATVAAWLGAQEPPASGQPATDDEPAPVLELDVDGRSVRESPVWIEHPDGALFGVLAEPADGRRAPVAGVLLNAGGVRRIGPNRLWVETARAWAARGVPTLRLDLVGLGDSGDGPGIEAVVDFYTPQLQDQAEAGIRWLADREGIGRIVAAGLCSGGHWAFHAAASDERVRAAVLINVGALMWDRNVAAPSWPPGPRALLSPEGLRKAGPGLPAALGRWAWATLRRHATFLRTRRAIESRLDLLRAQGTRIVFALGELEPEQLWLGNSAHRRRLARWPNATIADLPGRDHTVRPIAAQRRVRAVLDAALDGELGSSGVAAMTSNARAWSEAGRPLVDAYLGEQLAPAEAALLARHREALTGRVLELGPGAGRFTTHLARIAHELYALDISPAMVEHAGHALASVTFAVGDMKDLSRYEDGSFDAVVAIANVIDVFGEGDRAAALAEIRRVLTPGGLLLFNSHNLAHAPFVDRPWNLRRDHLREDLTHLPRRVANHRRVRHLEHRAAGHAVINDISHDFAMVHYYIGRDEQAARLAARGFELLECLDVEARPVGPGEQAPRSSSLHYAARAR